jgi:hypothetical protein
MDLIGYENNEDIYNIELPETTAKYPALKYILSILLHKS